MPRILPMIASLAMSLLVLSATASPAFATRTAPDFRLTAVTPVTGTKISGETLWRCNTTGCTAAAGNSRPAIICAQAARALGPLESFSFRDTAFEADALAKCNAKAK
jgi:hypothetical protein